MKLIFPLFIVAISAGPVSAFMPATLGTRSVNKLYSMQDEKPNETKVEEFNAAELKQSVAELNQKRSELNEPISISSTGSIGDQLVAEIKELAECLSTAYGYVSTNPAEVKAEDIVKLCDIIDEEVAKDSTGLVAENLELKRRALELGRYHLLTKLMKTDYDAYVATAGFLSPSRIDRLDLPNVQDVPFNEIMPSMENGDELVEDCTLEDMKFNDNLLDTLLLKIFRNLVEKNTNGVTSSTPGINGLVEQGRTFMLQPNQTAEAQHKMVSQTLGDLMTPVLPPFYRIFMSGIVPKLGTDFDGKQIGPWFYG